MPKRKVIQIAATPETADGYGQLFVLCSDGQLYVTPYPKNADFTDPTWQRIHVPQPEND